MKKKTFVISVAAILILSFALFSGCAYSQHAEQNNTHNLSQASSSKALTNELVRISPDTAIDIVLKDAGVLREDAVMFGVPSLDEEDENTHYDIAFAFGGFAYDYEVSVADGSILKSEKEAEKDVVTKTEAPVKTETPTKTEAPVKAETPTKTEAPAKTETPAKTESPAKTDVPAVNTNNGYIGIETAKQKALEDAGVKAEDATFLKAHYDSDDIIPHYDIEFYANGYEYDYEIKAADGSVIEKEIDKEEKAVNAAPAADEYISADSANALAFEHAGINASDVGLLETELDLDDLIAHYDIEFVVGNYEYEYEINAKTGNVIAFGKELND